ncbi:MAG: hypothetical protein V7642_778 [Burkholderiales bacterium]|jgi:hypothetical protein
MAVGNKSVVRTSGRAKSAAVELMTTEQLLRLSVAQFTRWFKRKMIEAQLRSLHSMAEYFAWQQENGSAGLADTHKRIAMAKSDLHRL